jgi:thiol:disulfide interchange protein DsbA
MTPRFLLQAFLPALLVLTACNAPTPSTSDTPATSATAAQPASADEPAASGPAASVSASTAANPAAAAAADAALAADPSGLVEGRDYATIKDAEPWKPLNGKIEVVEIFGYVCPACATFDPLVTAWKNKLPADVRFTYVPAPFGPEWNPYAKAFYVAEAMNLVDRTHNDVIRAIHIEQSLPGEGDKPDEAAIANFYGKYGANPKEFLSTMNSFTVAGQVNRGRQFMIRTGTSGTPTLIINGKYRVMGKSFEDMLRIASMLIARERAATSGAAAAAPPQG